MKTQTENAKAEMKSIYDNRKYCVASDQKYLCSTYEVHVEKKKLYQIENWLQYYRGVFKNSMKEVKKKAIANTKSVQTYFVTKHKAEKKRKQQL